MEEQDIQRTILIYLKEQCIFHWRNNSGKKGKYTFGLKGSSDIIGILPNGRFLAIEVKYGKNKPSEDQVAFIKNINDNGGLAFVAYDLETVVKALDTN